MGYGREVRYKRGVTVKNKSHRKVIDVKKLSGQNNPAVDKKLSYIVQILGTLDQRIHNLEMGNSFTSSVEIYRTDVREIFLSAQPVDGSDDELEGSIQYAFDAADMIEEEFSRRMKARLEEAKKKQEEEAAVAKKTVETAREEAERIIEDAQKETEEGEAEAPQGES